VNVFDERELELLIGGIADIDVDDWKKHTDYRGYTESDEVIVSFWKVSDMSLVRNDQHADKNSASGVGMPSRNPDYCSSLPVLHESQSMASRICRVVMDREGSRLRRLVNRTNCLRVTPGMFPHYSLAVAMANCVLVSIVWTCHRIRRTRRSTGSSLSPSRRRLGSVRSRPLQ
jgi:hypothetical protein